ncbi:ISL3 family transposase ISMac21 [Candidatus Magnetaquicoccaceae bacterium FCR-1]|uniref:ISL3 family transposase ISMac21 n=1 Tax=Candidatus Magnetaquiglobus chichijimensis TaxID=3141448 RepID=A0ABQ0C692_9PROT
MLWIRSDARRCARASAVQDPLHLAQLQLKNPGNLTAKQQATLATLKERNLKTARAYQIRLTLQELFQTRSRQEGEAFLKKWYFWATHSRLPPIVAAAKTIKNHWDGVLNGFHSGLTTVG